MSFVAAATSVGAAVLGTGAAAGIGSTIVGGALIGAGVGGAYSAITGDGKILDSMLTGAGIGGLAGGIGGAMFPGAAGYAAPASGTLGTAAESAIASNTSRALFSFELRYPTKPLESLYATNGPLFMTVNICAIFCSALRT